MTSRSLDEHRLDVLGRVAPLAPLDLTLAEAVGCVLVADAIAPDHVPPVPMAAHDGFAVRSEDARGAHMRSVRLPVTHDARAGEAPSRLLPGTSVRVASGASLPFGADAVVARPTEAAGAVLLDAEVTAGDGVVPRGAHGGRGEVLVTAGTVVGPGQVAALAAAGLATAVVRPSPRVAIVAVGTELVAPGAAARRAGGPEEPVFEAAGALLAALVAGAGGRVARVVSVPDEPRALRAAIDDAAVRAELVLVVGGLSGDWADVARPVLEHAYDVHVHSVRVRPGEVHGVGAASDGRGGRVPLLALPGPPLAAAAAFMGYVRDAIGRLKGKDVPLAPARAAAAFAVPAGAAHVVPVARDGAGGERAAIIGNPARPTLRDLAAADGLALLDEQSGGAAKGGALQVAWWHA